MCLGLEGHYKKSSFLFLGFDLTLDLMELAMPLAAFSSDQQKVPDELETHDSKISWKDLEEAAHTAAMGN